MENKELTICDFLVQSKDKKEDSFFKSKNECFKIELEEVFKCNIDCALYDQVVNGVGKEKEKINVPYSSSLQSLLFFSQVSKDNPLTIILDNEQVIFDKVRFEYRNKVINRPSCMDVVLVNDKEDTVIFIESKLAEIARDSRKKNDVEGDGDVPGSKVVGITYFFKKEENGYSQKLKLNECDLKRIGIVFPEEEGSYPIEKRVRKGSNDARITLPYYQCTNKREDANSTYVYSYGIKQILSHIIGILNFRDNKNDAQCSNEFNKYSSGTKIYFMEIFNELPGDEEILKNIREIQEEYKKHVDVVYEVLSEKNLGIEMLHTTYQELYEGRGDYKLSNKIVDFYRLDEKTSW